MSETDTAVPPALTREEWEVVMGRGVVAGRPNSRDYLGDHPTVLHFRMAVANAGLPDDHPGKITRADAVFLRAFAEQYADEWRDGEWGGETAHLRQIVAKLAALLPP